MLRQLATAFGFAHRPAVFHRFLRQIQLLVQRQVDERACVSHFQVALEQQFLHGFGQFQQAQAVGNGAAAASHGFGNGFVGQFEFVNQTAQALRFFNRIEVFTLDVFNQPHCHHGFVVGLLHHGGQFGQPRQLCRAPTPLARDEFVAVQAVFAHDDGLDDALRFNRFRQFLQGFVLHLHTRLIAAGLDFLNRDLAQLVAAAHIDMAAAHQGVQPAFQAGFVF